MLVDDVEDALDLVLVLQDAVDAALDLLLTGVDPAPTSVLAAVTNAATARRRACAAGSRPTEN